MRSSSAVFILAVTAAATPAFAAPLSTSPYARRQDTSTDADSDAISLKTLGTIFSVGAPVVGGIFDHFFKGNSSQRREYEEILARQATDVDSSEAISLKTLGTIFSVGAPIVGGIFDHFFKGNSSQRREFDEIFTRQATDDDLSDAISLKTLGPIFSVGAPIIGGIFDHFFKSNSSQRREYEEIFARQTTDMSQSDAIKLGTLGTIFSLGVPIIGGIFDHFKGNSSQRREYDEDIFARQTTDVDTSDAISLSTLGTIFSVGAPIVGGIFDHFFKGNSSQRRELEELMARSDDMDSGALLTSIISSIPVSVLQHSLKGGLNSLD
ncbi:hypothetical protein BC835DRAFT_1361677 [Cytidiella melzeri]|nr:hypothetical protein BC835DRAFT_1361677 [Cytidiella melzeri]